MFLNFDSKVTCGSGMLISKNLVLTAAHNLYDKDLSLLQQLKGQTNLKKLEYDKTKFRFYNGEILGEKYYEIEDWRYLPEYMTSPSDKKGFKSDYALVKLKTKTNYG
jgi:V8-like Glu-specific endopeptidase